MIYKSPNRGSVCYIFMRVLKEERSEDSNAPRRRYSFGYFRSAYDRKELDLWQYFVVRCVLLF